MLLIVEHEHFMILYNAPVTCIKDYTVFPDIIYTTVSQTSVATDTFIHPRNML